MPSGPQAAICHPVRGQPEQTKRGEVCHDPGLAGLQARGRLPRRGLAGEHGGGQPRLPEATVTDRTFGVQKTGIVARQAGAWCALVAVKAALRDLGV